VAAEAVSMAGLPVWIAEKACPSPALSLLVRQRGAAGGIMITASHNPYKWNGVKFKASYGSSALPSIVAQVEKELATVLANGVPPLPTQPDRIQTLNMLSPYLETIEKIVDWERIRTAKFRFVADPMHGAARGLLRELMTRHGVVCDEIRGTRDPLFGGVNPEPIEPHVEALRRAVLAGKYDAGLCADGDGDRIGAMDRDGTFITPHQIFSILLWHLAGTRGIPGDVAKTFSSTKMLDKIAEKFGRKIFETPIGFKYICELMLERDILLGGEESGGIGTKLYLPERDATVMALLLVEVMAWHKKSLGELVAQLHAEFGEHHYGRIDMELKPGQKERAIEHFSGAKVKRVLEYDVARRENLDGIKVYLGDTGWVMLRASGTEPMLRVYSETRSPSTTRKILEEARSIVQGL
jgi:phosphomannomutase